MVHLRSGVVTATDRPIARDVDMEYIPGHFELLQVQRNKREMTALGLVVDGQLTDAALAAGRPLLPTEPLTHFFEPIIREDLCSEILWAEGEEPKQCKGKPSRGTTTCWRHAPNRRSAATAARQARTAARLQQRREEQRERQERERLLMRTYRRFGEDHVAPGEDDPVPYMFTYETRVAVDQRHPDIWNDAIHTRLRRTQQQPPTLRTPLLQNSVAAAFDNIADFLHLRKNIPRDMRHRCLDIGCVKLRDAPRQATFVKCSLCKLFQYPFETSIVPEQRVIECIECGCFVHRHCQVTVPPFYHDRLYRCPACVEGI